MNVLGLVPEFTLCIEFSHLGETAFIFDQHSVLLLLFDSFPQAARDDVKHM